MIATGSFELSRMPVTDEIFQTFLECETKAFLKFSCQGGTQSNFRDWQHYVAEDYNQECRTRLRSSVQENECCTGILPTKRVEVNKYSLVLDCHVQTQEMQSHIHALERSDLAFKTNQPPYIPVRFIPREKITKHDKLLLAFDALALYTTAGKRPLFGKIIHGNERRIIKIRLDELLKTAQSIVRKICAQQTGSTPPPLILNKHCTECEFQSRCRQAATEKDDLSLLSGMLEKELKKQHEKGIFSVTQLSYTFRPRRRAKSSSSKADKYHHALKALAIRERKIHITGRPQVNITGTPVYLDVEGIPDQDFYYLIGLRIKRAESFIQHSFWADDITEEKEIWISFIETLTKIENPQLIHYGRYETAFLKRMKRRYGGVVERPSFLDDLIAKSVNLLSFIYAQIYFPTYSNGLKDIARHLGFQWSNSKATGLDALAWRYKWELSKNPTLKKNLITYNADDCAALEQVADTVSRLCQKQAEGTKPSEIDNEIVYADSLKRSTLFSPRNKEFLIPEFKLINEAAYWDYQREKIYTRSGQRVKRVPRRTATPK